MNDNKLCSACKIKIDENKYKKDRTVIIKRKEKTNTTLQSTKQKSPMSTIRNKNKTTPMFQHMKIIAMSLLAQVTLIKCFTCSKYLKK